MSKFIIVTRPKYDDGTEYLAYYASLAIKQAKEQGLKIKDFEGKRANKVEVNNFVMKNEYDFLFLNGHGDDKSLFGHKDEIIFSINNMEIMANKITYARACNAGAFLGAQAVKDNNGCFIGYKFPFSFWIDEKWSAKPSNDNTAKLYLEPSNEVAISIIKGKTAKEADYISKNKMIENMKKILMLEKKKEPGAIGMLQVLWNNYEGQVLHGNSKMKIE